MYIDGNLQPSTAQAVTSTAVSEDTIDLQNRRDIGAGHELTMYFTVDTTATADGAATVTFQVIGSAAANLSSATVLGSTGPIALAGLTAGNRYAVKINPQLFGTGFRYLGANYVVATGPLTAGAFTASVVLDVADKKDYASGYSIQ